jgi:RTX calcium-binding nonapeptide repeat (4 copies)
MRPLLLAMMTLAFSAAPAHAAVIEIEDHFCGCDGSSGETDTRGIVVTAAAGETNVVTVRRSPRGIVIEDTGAPLTGRCRVARSGGRFCRGEFDGVDVLLGDGDDRLDHSTAGGTIQGGPGGDDIRVTTAIYLLAGGPGADRLDATGALGASVSYADHADDVTVRLNDIADDGAAGEGDNVIGPVTGLTGGAGDDLLEAGPAASGLTGGDGRDTLVGSPERDTLNGGEGDDELLGGDGGDYLTGAGGADVLSGGPGLDEVAYGGSEPLRLSIGDGANDGASGEGDDIREDVEGLTGGRGDDVLVGDEDGNRLIAYSGRDVLRAGGGDDELIGWGDGDELDAGPGADSVDAGALDRPLLADGERDRLMCRSRAPAIEADPFDELRSCAPRVTVRPLGRARAGRRLALRARCPLESAVPCEGRVWVHLRGGRRLSRAVHFGPIEPGGRESVTIRLRSFPRRAMCLQATTRTRRDDGLDTVTETPSVFACLPR